mmetsp:Transcript_55615/g.121142  ORF Transcript_55615/g.121142 Transcript_55615/m.121142 type:complete len:659 (+) Transcript_55615:109-2085(+)
MVTSPLQYSLSPTRIMQGASRWVGASVLSFRDNNRFCGTLPAASVTVSWASLDLSGCARLCGTLPSSWSLMVSLATLDIRHTALRFNPGDTSESVGLVAVSSIFAEAHRDSSALTCRCPTLTSRARPGALNVRFDPALYSWSLCVCNDGDVGREGMCQPCPFGASCSKGGSLFTKEAFWCNATAYAHGDTVTCHACPTGYCCRNSCPIMQQCVGNREGVLCGRCKTGYAAGLGTTACVDDTGDCNAVAWLVPAIVVLTGAFAIRTVAHRHVGQLYRDLLSQHGTVHYSLQLLWAVDILVYFYQVAPLSAATSLAASSTVVLTSITSVFNLDSDALISDDDAKGLCLVPGLTSTAKIALAPSVVVILFAWVGVLAVATSVKAAVRPAQLQRKTSGWSGPYEAHKVVAIATLQLGYSTALKSVFRLVHCVDVNGSSLLWVAAHVECYRPWQVLVAVLAAALAAYPMLLALWIRRQVKHLQPDVLAGTGVFYSLVSPFRAGCEFWSALLFALRFAFVATHTLANSPVHRAMLLVALSILSLTLSAHFRPHRTAALCAGDILLQSTTAFVAAVGMASLSLQEALTSDHVLNTPGTVSATLLILPVPLFLVVAVMAVVNDRGLLPSCLHRRYQPSHTQLETTPNDEDRDMPMETWQSQNAAWC